MLLSEISRHLASGRATPIAWRSTIADTRHLPGDVVWVPFPYVETSEVRNRPALVIATAEPAQGLSLLWVLMITSAANMGWAGDVSLETRYGECGLKVPCVVRTAKITTIEAGQAERAGALPDDLLTHVMIELEQLMPSRSRP